MKATFQLPAAINCTTVSSLEMKKGKRLKSVSGEAQLPEAMIQHIQSFLGRKEAARTTFLSKSWYNAWLTRPILDFDAYDFTKPSEFDVFALKSMQRYQDLSLKIDQLRLRTQINWSTEPIANRLVVNAMKLGATELNLELLSDKSILPREVLESETLVRLSLSGRTIGGNVGCWRLKSLVLSSVHLRGNMMLRNIISCCKLIEELSISDCTNCKGRRFDMSGVHLHELHLLKHLCLKKVAVDPLFFSDFVASRFLCLKELRLADCSGYDNSLIKIESTSVERISIVMRVQGKALTAEMDVPNLVHFDYSGEGLPSLYIESSREWEYDLSIKPTQAVHTRKWFLKLKKLLAQSKPSKISLSLNMDRCNSPMRVDEEGEIEVEPYPVVVENLTVTPPYRLGYTIVTPLAGLLRICRPKFLIVDWATDDLLKIFDENMFGQIGLKEVSVQVYDELFAEWQPLLSLNDHFREKKRYQREMIRFQLRSG